MLFMASFEQISHIIQLAVAPVFLLTGVAALLGVLTTRFARITDRARLLEKHYNFVKDSEDGELVKFSLRSMWKRARLINRAIGLCVSAALMICLVVICLFLGEFLKVNLGTVIACLFILAMVLLSVGLIYLFREIHITTDSLKLGLTIVDDGVKRVDRVLKP